MVQEGEVCYSAEVDWWSAAVTFYRMWAGRFPFSGTGTFKSLAREICEGRLPKHGPLKGLGWDLLRAMLRKKKGERLYGLPAIQKHAYFLKFDWQALQKFKYKSPFVPDTGPGCNNFPQECLALPPAASEEDRLRQYEQFKYK